MGQETRMVNGVIYDEKTISFEKYIQLQCYIAGGTEGGENATIFNYDERAVHAKEIVDSILKLNNCKVEGVEDVTKKI